MPWSIIVADVATGEGRELWRAEPGVGSVFSPVAASQQLLWAAGDHLIFPWERDGWKHLYALSLSGGTPRRLTSGAFEVEHVALAPNRQEVFFSSNQDDIDRRHLWKVAVSGGQPQPVTRGAGIEWSPVRTADGRATAYLASDARRPAHVAVQVGSEAPRAIEALPADFPQAALVEPQPVILSAADGLPIHAQLFLSPQAATGGRLPAVVFFHGGSRRQMVLGWHYMYYYHNAYAMNQYLASRGYAVLSVNYRSGTGYGMEFREALNYGAAGASEFNDVLGAGLYLRSRPDIDPSRIGLWGGSYGGYLTALGLARASDLFIAGVDFHGVHEWSARPGRTVFAGDSPAAAEAARVAFASSPMAAIKTGRSPVLLIHGDDDRNVAFDQTVTLVEALRKQGVSFEQLIFPDEIHDFLKNAHWLKAYEAAARFLDKYLKEPPPKTGDKP